MRLVRGSWRREAAPSIASWSRLKHQKVPAVTQNTLTVHKSPASIVMHMYCIMLGRYLQHKVSEKDKFTQQGGERERERERERRSFPRT